MATIKLAENTFSLIPEGVTTFKVMEVDESKYDDFGKIAVKLQTAKGETHIETFSLLKDNGEINEGALKAWSFFARTCLNDFKVDEVDTQDIVGCYFSATVKHEKYIRTKGDKAGQEATSVRLNNYTSATGFTNQQNNDDDDLDDFLND